MSDDKKVVVNIKPPLEPMKPIIVVDNAPKIEMPDKEATVQCPKFNFQHALIDGICTNCQHFGGIEVSRDSATGRPVPNGTSFYNGAAVKCSYPLQRRIHPPFVVIKEG